MQEIYFSFFSRLSDNSAFKPKETERQIMEPKDRSNQLQEVTKQSKLKILLKHISLEILSIQKS